MTIKITPKLQMQPQLASIASRIADRDYPSIFQPWSNSVYPVVDAPTFRAFLSEITRHDLAWFGADVLLLQWDTSVVGAGSPLAATALTAASISNGLRARNFLQSNNKNLLLLAEVQYRDAPDSQLAANSVYWRRDGNGNRIPGWTGGASPYYLLDFARSDFRAVVAARAKAIIESGAFDGIMLDWWDESEDAAARLSLLQAVRDAIGPDALIIVNANNRTIPVSAPYVNGSFMEMFDSEVATSTKWNTYLTTLQWLEANTRQPRINCLETWWNWSNGTGGGSRNDLNRMRATTTLGLTVGNGYTVFADPNPLSTPDHLHDWYSFYDVNLGKPTAAGSLQGNGTWRREFTNGTVIYNPLGNVSVNVTFAESRLRASTGTTGTTFAVPAFDGDLFTFA